ncbi:predicted protein [Chaetoceros tenuissimus]|uniref:Uncharacterized protein n=1 Tax=Chaetoceros tenuissimus TaxID=426638 RepID=A0AAD3CUJ8_9STRA|nr:predicted protein [Chaetoceros tenuissimus]
MKMEMDHIDESSSDSDSSMTEEQQEIEDVRTNLNEYNFNEEILTAKKNTAEELCQIGKKALTIFEKYTKDNSKKFREDPSSALDEISNVTDSMRASWKNYSTTKSKIEEQKAQHDAVQDEKFREVYMNLVTEAFGDELDDLRSGKVRVEQVSKKKKSKNLGVESDVLMQDNIIMPTDDSADVVDMQILANMLESGMNSWTREERDLLILDNEQLSSKDQGKKNINKLTPHERRRRELFG